ncbi:hypothetical protein [Salana multivorans]
MDEQALIDEAVAALTEYLALANEVENNGGHGWEEKLKPWWGSEELVESAAKHFTTLVDAGWRSDGKLPRSSRSRAPYPTPSRDGSR